VGRLLLSRIEVVQPEALDEGISHSTRDATERRALVLSRIGQGDFRESLMRLWGGRCAVTGLDLPVLLRASHIKPWRDSDNRERLDPFNGLLLAPAYDAAFDAGLITFTDEGHVIQSDWLTPPRLQAAGLHPEAQIAGLQAGHRNYLGHHRQNVFIRRPT
jgi:predicted restriction endonuclease